MLIERLDPLFASHAFGWLDDLDMLRGSQARNEAVVVFGDPAEDALVMDGT